MAPLITPDTLNEWRSLLLVHKFALDQVETKLNILNEEFQMIHMHNPIEHIKSRVKTPESISDKLHRKGYELTIENARNYINDIAGIRIICSFVSDIYTIYDLIERQNDIEIICVKDYIKNPKPNGYRSLHLIAEIPVVLTDSTVKVKVEIQIRTIAMDFWASLEHKIYYKFDKTVPSKFTDEIKDCARIISLLDEKMLQLNNEIEKYK
jgi:putative GTP pyrophosphokinase